MMRPAKLLLACLAIGATGAAGGPAGSAESDAATPQQLDKVMASGQLVSATLVTHPGSYTVRIVLDVAKFNEREQAIHAANKAQRGANPPPPPPPQPPDAQRTSFFIGNEIANLRGLTPWSRCGKRTLGTRLTGQPTIETVLYDKDTRVTVWLLKSDGTQILPADYHCADEGATVAVQYKFNVAERERPAAAAVRIDHEYYIEPIQPQVQRPAAE